MALPIGKWWIRRKVNLNQADDLCWNYFGEYIRFTLQLYTPYVKIPQPDSKYVYTYIHRYVYTRSSVYNIFYSLHYYQRDALNHYQQLRIPFFFV